MRRPMLALIIMIAPILAGNAPDDPFGEEIRALTSALGSGWLTSDAGRAGRIAMLDAMPFQSRRLATIRRRATIRVPGLGRLVPRVHVAIYRYPDSVACRKALDAYLTAMGISHGVDMTSVKSIPTHMTITHATIRVISMACETSGTEEVRREWRRCVEAIDGVSVENGSGGMALDIGCGGPAHWSAITPR